ncbi:MAG TPA: alpha/beta hydrolase [Nevskiaceae bacterium]|nr:alpha/beta hydrolase [Nevskiaceae bacterium]
MRILKRVILSIVAIVVFGGIALVLYVIGPTTMRLMDPELLIGIPSGVLAMSKPPATVAERQAAGGPLRYAEQWVPGADGDPPVRVVIVEPKDAAPGRPGILDIHGGGYMYGSPEMNLTPLLDGLVRKFGVTAVSVDYRLAPGTRYPGSLHDNYAALKWFHDHAPDMGVDPQRIAIMGLSAGGGHAAALSLHARDRGEVLILFQVLLCPMLDDRTGSTIDPGETLGRFLWTRESNRKGWTALLGVEAGSDAVPAGAVPMRVADLSRLPPTYIAVGSLDLFAKENVDFAQKLKDAGVPTELHVFPGGFHGFEFIVPSATVSRQARAAHEAYMARGFGLH